MVAVKPRPKQQTATKPPGTVHLHEPWEPRTSEPTRKTEPHLKLTLPSNSCPRVHSLLHSLNHYLAGSDHCTETETALNRTKRKRFKTHPRNRDEPKSNVALGESTHQNTSDTHAQAQSAFEFNTHCTL